MTLRDYQEKISTDASDCISENGLAYLAMECRTGKTLTALVTAQKYGAKRVLFITKKKAIESVRRDYETLQKLTPSFEIEIINYESCHKQTINPDFIICDEAHSMGAYPKSNHSSLRLRKSMWRVSMTLSAKTRKRSRNLLMRKRKSKSRKPKRSRKRRQGKGTPTWMPISPYLLTTPIKSETSVRCSVFRRVKSS